MGKNAPQRESLWGISGRGRGLGEICLETAYSKEWDESNQKPSKRMKVSLGDFSAAGNDCEKVTVAEGRLVYNTNKERQSQPESR